MIRTEEDSPFAPDGETPWWHLEKHPGKPRQRFGGERRLAAYLYFNVGIGETFTMRDLRRYLGSDAVPEDAEHLNRRLRQLRAEDWIITSYKDASLRNDTYRLDDVGLKIWVGKRIRVTRISKRLRREVLERDGSRCRVCGVVGGDSYPREPGTKAKLTIGHRIPRERGGTDDHDNLRTECSRCNEPVRDTLPDPESLEEVVAQVREFGRADASTLLHWITNGEKPPTRLDTAYARIRSLSPAQQAEVLQRLRKKLGS